MIKEGKIVPLRDFDTLRSIQRDSPVLRALYFPCLLYTSKLIGKLGEFSPDIVILLNVHGYYLNENSLFEYLGDADIPVLNIMPDEYPFLGKCCFSFDCTKYETKCCLLYTSHK